MELNSKSDVLLRFLTLIDFLELVMHGIANPINYIHVFVAHIFLWNHQCGIATLTIS